MRAQKAQAKAARVQFDWPDLDGVMAKVDEELAETKEALTAGEPGAVAEEIGDLLFAVVNLARKSGLEAEAVLQAATDKFVRRFAEMEKTLAEEGGTLGEAGLAELDAIWNRHKASRAAQA